MRRGLFAGMTALLGLPVIIFGLQRYEVSQLFTAMADPPALMQGCMDVPEAVALAETLRDRSLRIERYMEALDMRRADIATAEQTLRERLAELKSHKTDTRTRRDTNSSELRNDIDRLVAVYDQMKPADAAAILTNLPADFAAEILMRVQPENGARIIAAVEPRQAALLTAQMGARSIRTR